MVVTIVASERAEESHPARQAVATATSAALPDGVVARATVTTNLRVAPGRQSEIVAIVPTGEVVVVAARSADKRWLRVIYPPTSQLGGWAATTNFDVLAGNVDAVAIASASGTGATNETVGTQDAADPLPDLSLVDAYLLPNGSLTVVVENIGTGRFSGTIGLQVTSAGGELLGVLDIQETVLLPQRAATVDTGVVIRSAGNYAIELDRLDRIEELSEFNNATRVFLVPTSPS